MSLPSLEWVNQDSAFLRQQRAGFAWLRFAPTLEAAFRNYYALANLRRMRGAVLVSCIIWSLFAFLDFISMPAEFRLQSLALRVLVLPLLLLGWWATYRPAWHRHLQVLVGIGALAAGLAVSGVIWLARSHQFALPYEGIILLTIFFYFVVGLRCSTASWCGWLTFAAYLMVELNTGLAAQVLIYNAFFLGAANVVGSFGNYFFEYSARETFIAQGLLEDIAERDFLTGLLNRRAFSQQANRSWRHAVRAQQPVAVLMLDVDFFKNYNDHYGHAQGDLALQAVARALGSHAQRPLDVLARYGGEEFIGLWLDVSQEAIEALAERIRADVQALALSHQYSSVAAEVTISIGVAYFLAPQPGALEEAQRLADSALYAAKAQGRNRVVVRAVTL
ncbi:MAG: GGDEF domain-containing protein [Pseudomonadaceae bacterium]|nr:GGDEF domain-containing protein [Pseudomonadaceae bacterium]